MLNKRVLPKKLLPDRMISGLVEIVVSQQLAATGSSRKRTIWIINRMTSADTKSFFINMPPPYEKI